MYACFKLRLWSLRSPYWYKWNSALIGCTGPRTPWAYEMICCMNHAPDTGSLTRPTDLQSSVILLYYYCYPSPDWKDSTISQDWCLFGTAIIHYIVMLLLCFFLALLYHSCVTEYTLLRNWFSALWCYMFVCTAVTGFFTHQKNLIAYRRSLLCRLARSNSWRMNE